MHQRDGRTDTGPQQILRLRLASRGKKEVHKDIDRLDDFTGSMSLLLLKFLMCHLTEIRDNT